MKSFRPLTGKIKVLYSVQLGQFNGLCKFPSPYGEDKGFIVELWVSLSIRLMVSVPLRGR